MQIELPPSLGQFVAEKIKNGDYVDVSEVIRDSLRRWKEQEELLRADTGWLEQQLVEGVNSPDVPAKETFWKELKGELHKENSGRGGTR